MSKWHFPFHKAEAEEERWILSIDGGGIRGIVPSVILAHLNDLLREEGDARPLYSHFDLVTGTSTGGIIALALSSPLKGNILAQEKGDPFPVYELQRKGLFRKENVLRGTIPHLASPETFKDVYMKNGTEIFSPRSSFFGTLFSEKYDVRVFSSFLNRLYGDSFMSEMRVPTAVVCYNAKESKPYLFKSYGTSDYPLWQAARATAAAPLYFPPANFTDCESHERFSLVDGGMIANNPALLAYREARALYPKCKHFHMLSLSTGSPQYAYDTADINGGVTSWMEPATKIYAYTQMKMVDLTAAAIDGLEYIRIWKEISKEKIKMDDIRPDTLKSLYNGAESTFDETKELLKMVAKALAEKPLSKEFALDNPIKKLDSSASDVKRLEQL